MYIFGAKNNIWDIALTFYSYICFQGHDLNRLCACSRR